MKGNKMRILAIILNVLIALFISGAMIFNAAEISFEDVLIGFLLMLYPCFHIFVLIRDPQKSIWKNTWIVLYFKRKALEEKKKIESMSEV
jgi:hypothetical protein